MFKDLRTLVKLLRQKRPVPQLKEIGEHLMSNKISVALSGSGFKFPAHLGGLKAIQDSEREIVEISGVSGGAIVGGLLACGRTVDEMTKVMMTKNWAPLYRFNPVNLLSKGGMVEGTAVYEYLLEETRGKTFKEVDIPLHIPTTDLTTGEEFVFSCENTPDAEVALAIRASIAIPGIFCPARYEHRVLVDGVVINSLPLGHLKEEAMHIGIKLLHTGAPNDHYLVKDLPDSIKLAYQVIRESLFVMVDRHDEWMLKYKGADNVVRVNTQYADPLDPKMPKEDRMQLFKDCYLETRKFLKR